MTPIESVRGLEILDSRGRPTVKATCKLASGVLATASVPSGASTGTAEAMELRDGDSHRYGGLGCRHAASNISGPINDATCGQDLDQSALDRVMKELDGTANKSTLGANAILAVSIAAARALAAEAGLPLYRYFAQMIGSTSCALPQLTVNLFSGGKHAGGQVPIQDVLVVPVAAHSIDESLATVYAVYQAAAGLVQRKYGIRLLRADEGGLAPPCANSESMIEDAIEAISLAGFRPGVEVALAVDVASTHFYSDGRYELGAESLDSGEMIAMLQRWVRDYPIVSVEDGLAEEDWAHWPELRAALSPGAIVLGDDLLCTNPGRIRRAVQSQAADALLLKVNQVGTLTEAAEAFRLAKAAGWHVTASARSGETEDNWLADLAVGWAADQIKVGSITQSERLAKYNRLLEIEAEGELGSSAR